MLVRTLFGLAALPFIAAEDASESVAVDTSNIDGGFSDEDKAALEANAEKHEFQAEVNRLMDIIINSLYTDKTVFLRELISNSADALEKARFTSVQDDSFLGDAKDLEIKIEFDPEEKTLSLIDTGIGMTKSDLINNLGTVAKSGTTNFLEALSEGSDANLIGQFGVGFYSAFLVADKVTVISKNNDDDTQNVWESTADASFTVAEDPRGNTLGRGTKVMLHLKEDAHEFLNEDKLKELSKRFSQFIQFPIYISTKKEVENEDDDDDEDFDDDEDEDEVDVKDEDEEKEEEKEEKKPKKSVVYEWEQVNTQKAVWLRAKEDVTEEEYVEFYKSISKDYLEPLAYTHFSAEGEIEFKSILFVPKKAPFDMMDNYWTKKSEIKLYVRRVLVAEKFEELLPRYLNFVRGVVDSDDLPLNVAREALQQNKIMKVISKKLVRKSLELLKKLAKSSETDDEDEEEDKAEKEEGEDEKEEKKDEETDFDKFYKEFGKNLKMGCYEDDSNRSKLAKLLRFLSTESSEKPVSLDSYLDRMKESQESIYYMSGDSVDIMKKSPALQVFNKKNLEVLLLDDHLDEPCIQKLADFEGKKFVSIQKADVKLDETEEDKKNFGKLKDMMKPLTDFMKETLTDFTEKGDMKDSGVKVDKIEISKRLVDSPVVVVTSQWGYSAQQEKIMRAQAFQNKEQMATMSGRKVLEVNPYHPVIWDLYQKVKENKEDETAISTTQMLWQAALLEGGYEIADPSALVKRVYGLMSSELGVDRDAPLVEIELPEDPEPEPEAEAEEAGEEEETDDADEESSDDKKDEDL